MRGIKIDIKKLEWGKIQADHDNGVSLFQLSKSYNISRNVIQRAENEGFFKRRYKIIKKPISDQARKNISESRKKWLSENLDKHPWRKKNKFTSLPCEQLKEFFRSKSIEFEEEVLISDTANYSVDILFP